MRIFIQHQNSAISDIHLYIGYKYINFSVFEKQERQNKQNYTKDMKTKFMLEVIIYKETLKWPVPDFI